jgi:hypothetical protein
VAFVLAVALVVPLVGVAGSVALPERGPTAVRVAALVSAGAWLLLLFDGTLVTAGAFHSAPLVAAAGLGASLVATAIDVGLLERPPVLAVALAALVLGLAGGRSATDGGGLIVGLAVAVGAAAWAARARSAVWVARTQPWMLVPGLAAVVAGAVGVIALRSAANSWALPAAGPSPHRGEGLMLLLAALLFVLCGSERARTPAALLVPAGLFLGAVSAPLVGGADGSAPVSLALATVACVAALAARAGRPLVDRPVAALGLLSLAVLTGPGAARPAGLLLASAATLAAAIGVPGGAVLGFPGVVGVAIALATRGGAAALAEGVLAGIVALALAAAALRAGAPDRPRLWALPPLAAGTWLLVAPGSWTWVGFAGLKSYDLGAALAAAGAGLYLASVELRRRVPGRWYARTSSRAPQDAVHH